MKYFTGPSLLYFLFLSTISFYSEGVVTGRLSTFISNPSGFQSSLTPYCIDTASYVNGGVTFTYPAGLFSATPTIRVSLEENTTAYSTSQVFVAEITVNSATATTIRVNLVTTSSITEASSDEVTVHIFAIEM